MPRPQDDADPDRRRFLLTLGVAGVSSVLAPPLVALSQTSPSSTGAPAAKPDSTAAPAPAAPAEISEDARSLAEVVRRRYGKHLSAEQLEAVTREIDGRIQGGKRLRESTLANGDEPDFVFHP